MPPKGEAQKRFYKYADQKTNSKECVPPTLVDEMGSLLSTGMEKDGILKKLFASIFIDHQISHVSQVSEHVGRMGEWVPSHCQRKAGLRSPDEAE